MAEMQVTSKTCAGDKAAKVWLQYSPSSPNITPEQIPKTRISSVSRFAYHTVPFSPKQRYG